uniref:(northern house mosquito) hypothetical protein n=1 Tax=Culex pipiens TaxID=7175 RepID=A0A8D8CL31_CULPI
MLVYSGARVALEDALGQLEPAARAPAPLMEQTFQQQPGRADHLPRLELPTYNGNPIEWLAFKGRFEKRIANITEDSDKYAFLMKCLEGFSTARNKIDALENSGAKFQDAWVKLEYLSYKKRLAFEGYFFKVVRFKRITTPNPKAIMNLMDVVDTAIHAAKQIQADANPALDCVADGLLVALVKSKLDSETSSRIEDAMDIHTVYGWDAFREELEKRTSQMVSHYSENEKEKHAKTVGAITANDSENKRPKKPKNPRDSACFVC